MAGVAEGQGGARRSGRTWESLWRWSPLMSAGAPSEAGGKGRRGDGDRRDRPVWEDGSSRGLPETRGSGGGGSESDTPGTAEAATAAATLTDCQAGGESRPQQLCNSLSSHFGSLRLRHRF